ncbi:MULTISPECIES: hypothetical protein [Bosea]|jgi:hypothetical protein|uniref:Uncharacterized protein n=1 Tax=Bosea robiniae TaxID=1036780 RepID=A0ABY0NSA7_9HYPH|nr:MULTISPECIES: hypothetical protein [Bosea]TQI72698.1 hypothetical protein FHT98_0410 [Bosea sp. AK1]SDG02401.1 hypothetical protein SAMN05421844_102651 [Bosea robiniae]
MQRRDFLIALAGLVASGATAALTAPAEAAPSRLSLDQALAAAPETDAEFSLLVGRLTHRRRAGGWWRHRVAAARRWGRRGRPGRR